MVRIEGTTMGRLAFFTLFCSILAGSEAQEPRVVIERNVPVPMRDGTILRADVYRPDRGGPYPVIVQRTPYGKGGNYGFEECAKAGYIVVSQDVRGRYESEGTWEPLVRLQTHDAEDGYDTIEWAAKLPGSSGKVGGLGVSYEAFLQWRLAPLCPPSFVVMSVSNTAAHGWIEGLGMMPAGILEWWYTSISPETRRRANRPGIHASWEAAALWNRGESGKWVNFLPRFELPRDFFEDEEDAVKCLLKNPHIDPRQLDRGCKEISVPNLEIAGWYDETNGDMLLFRTMANEAKTKVARENTRIIIGPWGHRSSSREINNIDFGPNAELDSVATRIRWFDYWLKGIENGVDKDAPVKIFVMGDNKWRDEQSWPLQRMKEKTFFITSEGHANTTSGDGKLVIQAPTSSFVDSYIYDPQNPIPSGGRGASRRFFPYDQRYVASREDILVYQTDPLTERVEVTGNPVVELYASSSCPDTDWFVRLIDVYPDGFALDVSHGFLRARYRNGLDKPELITPGDIVKYTIRMRPTSNAFLPGHRIRLDITSSDFPNHDRNHNTASDQNTNATLVTANQTIYHGGEKITRIILPWILNPVSVEEGASEAALEKQDYSLSKAVADGDIERIKLLISNGVDINVKDETGMDPLAYAVEAGKLEVVELLIQAGADINAGPWTALHSAARRGHRDIAEYLIQAGAHINAGPYTALHSAVQRGHRDIAEYLIQAGAHINAKDDGGRTPLHVATNANRREMIELLLSKGADINAKDVSGRTVLIGMVARGRRDMAELLIEKGAYIKVKDNNGLTSLHIAAVGNRRDFVELLLSKGVQVDERDDNYEFTALHYAVRFGNKNVAEILTAHGADIKAKDKWDYEPIHWAAYHDRPEIIELLIAKGADVNVKTSLGQTPLELAIPRRNTGAIEVLRKHGAK